MNKKSIFITGFTIVTVIVGIYFLGGKTANNQPPSNLFSTTPVSVSQSEWKTYENTAYHYSVKYPKTWLVSQVLEEDRKTVEKSRMVELSSDLLPVVTGGYVGITTWDPAEFSGSDQASVEFRQSMSVDLKSFAEATHQKEISERNDILPNKKVGELMEVVFAGQKAFSYIVTGSYDKYGGNSANYVFLENKGVKFMIYYSLNASLSQEIADTFELANNSTNKSTQY